MNEHKWIYIFKNLEKGEVFNFYSKPPVYGPGPWRKTGQRTYCEASNYQSRRHTCGMRVLVTKVESVKCQP